ncbi:MAG TPA: alpha/beta hydrolase, partial [Sporolactobacillaceae bacterium]|nr:alpha/beta hydrolase [Sporolactobacillaceae bacterium]
LLLHGFPENHYSWRHQMAPLGARFKVVAPDLRGYNLTERKGPYDIKTLCADVMGLIRAYGREQAVVAGHDWGAIILWSFALEYPEALRRLIALNVSFIPRQPKPPLEILTDARFDYIRFFQKRGDAEAMIEPDIDGFIRNAFMNNASRKEMFTDADLKVFADGFRGPGGITPAIEYYRNFNHNWEITADHAGRKVMTPSLMLVAEKDPVLKPEMADNIAKYVPDVTVKRIDCGHWTQQEAPDETNRAILEFLADLK